MTAALATYRHFYILTSVMTAILLTQSTQQAHGAQFAAENKKILLKVNFGGGPISDFLGEDQVMDMSDFAKNVARVKIANTDQPEIFQSNRFGRGTHMSFRIPVPTGVYSLTLLFAETYTPACVPGGRVFDISLGTPSSGVSRIVEGFDVFQTAGCLSAHGKRFDRVPSKDGIVVHLERKTQHPAVCGFIIEGFSLPRGDGSEYKTIGRETGDSATMPQAAMMQGGQDAQDPNANPQVGVHAAVQPAPDGMPGGSPDGMPGGSPDGMPAGMPPPMGMPAGYPPAGHRRRSRRRL